MKYYKHVGRYIKLGQKTKRDFAAGVTWDGKDAVDYWVTHKNYSIFI